MLKSIDLFAGIGGIRLGFEKAFGDELKTVFVSEWDEYAQKTYKANFHDDFEIAGDITKIKETDIPDFDICLAGFPCQAFSLAGQRKGFKDDYKGMSRGTLFFDVARICAEKKPKVIFCENVKGLTIHDKGRTFEIITETLKEIGYTPFEQILNSRNFGVPQNRERIYIVAFRDEKDFNKFHWPLSIPLTTTVKDIIDFDTKVDDKYYYTEGKYKGDIYKLLVEATKDDDINHPAIYQWRRKYVRQNKSGVVPTLTANQGEGGHNVCIVKTKQGLRKMTPRECFNTQGFPKNYKLPKKQSDARLYKQAGNSVCVPVINRIAENILEAIK